MFHFSKLKFRHASLTARFIDKSLFSCILDLMFLNTVAVFHTLFLVQDVSYTERISSLMTHEKDLFSF